MRKFSKKILYYIAGLTVIYLLLLIPDAPKKYSISETGKKVFAWTEDAANVD